METIRDRAIGTLSHIVNEMTAYEDTIYAHNDPAAKVIGSAKIHVIRLRDRYADGAPKEIHPLAAQELRELCDLLEKTGDDSGNANAADTLRHLSGTLSHFMMNAAPEILVASDGLRFLL